MMKWRGAGLQALVQERTDQIEYCNNHGKQPELHTPEPEMEKVKHLKNFE